jgi:hypothetical protein
MKLTNPLFTSAKAVDKLIAQYFKWIEGEYIEETESKPAKNTADTAEQKAHTREPEPATIAGLALHLGFESRQAFEEYEAVGKYAGKLKRARLRIEAGYEMKLHKQSPTGAIFALKNMGWNERTDSKPTDGAVNPVLKIEIIQSGPQLASSENEVVL